MSERAILRLPVRIGDLRPWSLTFHVRRVASDPLDGGDYSDYWPEAVPDGGLDALVLNSVPLARPPRAFSVRGGLIRYVADRYDRHFVDLTEDFDSYLQRLSGKTRNTLKRKVKKFRQAAGGEIDWRVYRTPEELAVFHRGAVQLARKTYQARLFDAGLPETPDFLEDMMARGRRGKARGYLLFLDGRAVSYLYTPIGEDGTADYAYLGYDPADAGLSPGTVLQMLAFEDQFADPAVRTFDFTGGDGQHKRIFASRSVACGDLLFVRDTLKWRGLLLAHLAAERTAEGVGGVLDKLSLKPLVRRIVRGQAAGAAGRDA